MDELRRYLEVIPGENNKEHVNIRHKSLAHMSELTLTYMKTNCTSRNTGTHRHQWNHAFVTRHPKGEESGSEKRQHLCHAAAQTSDSHSSIKFLHVAALKGAFPPTQTLKYSKMWLSQTVTAVRDGAKSPPLITAATAATNKYSSETKSLPEVKSPWRNPNSLTQHWRPQNTWKGKALKGSSTELV